MDEEIKKRSPRSKTASRKGGSHLASGNAGKKDTLKKSADAAERRRSEKRDAASSAEKQPIRVQSVATAESSAEATVPEEAAPVITKKVKKAAKPPREKKKHTFFWIMLVYILLFAGAIAVGFRYLWQYMEAFESTRPENYMKAYMASKTDEDWYAMLLKHTDIPVTRFESAEEVFRTYYDSTVSGDFTYSKKGGRYQDDRPVYSLRAGGKELAVITLGADESSPAPFGFSYWSVTDFQPVFTAADIERASVEILVPSTSTVFLNGIALGAEELTDAHVDYEDLTELERQMPDRPYLVRYRIDGLYLNISVSLDNEQELQPYLAENDCYYYHSLQTERHSVHLFAWSDMHVTVNGIDWPLEDAKATKWDLFDGLEEFVDAPYLCEYRLDGLYSEAIAVVTDRRGEPLTGEMDEESGAIIYRYPVSAELKQEQEAFVLEFLHRYINLASGDYNRRYDLYRALKPYVLEGTELANYFFKSVSGGGDGGGMLSVTLHELSADEFISVTDDCYICTAVLDATEKRYNTNVDYSAVYQIVVIRRDGKWYVAKMPLKDEE